MKICDNLLRFALFYTGFFSWCVLVSAGQNLSSVWASARPSHHDSLECRACDKLQRRKVQSKSRLVSTKPGTPVGKLWLYYQPTVEDAFVPSV